MTQTRRGRGRDGSLATIRFLLVLAPLLKNEGDTLSLASVMRRLGVERGEACELTQILQSVGDEETACYLPFFEDQDELVLARAPEHACRELRLSHLETMALAAALDLVGIEANSPLRTRVMSRFAYPGDTDASFPEAAKPNYPVPTEKLLRCALALLSERSLTFDYQGTRDAKARMRRVRPYALNPNDGKWTLDAFDLDADGERTFYLANMDNLALLDAALSHDGSQDAANTARRIVELRFSDRHMLDLFDWPDLAIEREAEGTIFAHIPFYGGPWLVRRIAAGGGSITTTDPELGALVRAYAEELRGI